jgi:phage repressor protein C with HTH and peptisase S24 domain
MDKSLILKEIKKYYNFKTDSEFADFLGIKQNTLSNWSTRNSIDYDRVISKCDEIDANWLITGKGSMLKVGANNYVVKESRDVYVLKTDRILDTQKIPLYNAEATAGVMPVFDDLAQQDPIDYLHIPNAPKCDGALMANGDSMYPLIKSGDILGYKIIEDLVNDIYWGQMYILYINVAGDTFRTIKFIHKGQTEEYLKLVSENKHHQDKEILISKVISIAQVKLLVRTY